MPDGEPIIVRGGVYAEAGEPEVLGLCIIIDNSNNQWDVVETENDTTIVTIQADSQWTVEEAIDPITSKKQVQIFCAGGNLNSIVLKHFIHPSEDVHTPSDNPPTGQLPEAKVLYTYPG